MKLLSLRSRINFHLGFLRIAGKRISNKVQARLNIGYIGALGDENLGDTVMLDGLREYFPSANIELIQADWIERRLSRMGLSGTRYFGMAFLGGGTLISPYWMNFVKTVQRMSIPMATCGTGVGSSGFGDPEEVHLDQWKPYLERFVALGVRGRLSEERLKHLGLEKAQTIGDLALLYVKAQRTAQPEKSVALNLTWRDDDGVNSEAIVGLKAAVTALHRDGWKIIPIAMHEPDVLPLKQFLEPITGRVEIIHQPKTAAAFFSLVEGCSCTFAIRLHAAILSCCVGVPPLMLGYRDKCADFMETMDLEQWHCKLQEASAAEVENTALELVASSAALSDTVLSRAQGLQKSVQSYLQSTVKLATGKKAH